MARSPLGCLVGAEQHVNYANAELLSEEVSRLVKEAKPPLVWLCISAAAVDDIDYTAAATEPVS
jgi:hypothetical protein